MIASEQISILFVKIPLLLLREIRAITTFPDLLTRLHKIQLQAGQLSAADAVLGQHALDSQLHGELGTLSHERAVLDVLEVADPAGVMIVVLVVELLAGEDCLVNIHDDDEIAAVNGSG